MNTFKKAILEVDRIDYDNNEYYNLISLQTVLLSLADQEFIAEDLVLTPYYICNKGILEIYDDELNIRIKDIPDITKYILKRTGKHYLQEIDHTIIRKFRMGYIELKRGKENLKIETVLNYIDFVFESKELEERIKSHDETFERTKIYFELY